MFSNFKNIVNSSLQELERLGELSAQQQRQHEQRERERGRNEQLYHNTLAAGGNAAGRTLSEQSRTQSDTALVTAAAQQPRATSPVSIKANGASDAVRRDSGDGIAPFGLSGLKRSLNALPRPSLDLPGIRTSLDAGSRPTSAVSAVSASSTTSAAATPSREGRELGEYPLSASHPQFIAMPAMSSVGRPKLTANTSSPRPRRRPSARSASLSGPYTPNTMMKMDPFFFASLQGLPDELKQAAFTPLPTEDDDELLEHLDIEFSPTTGKLPIPLPLSNGSASMPLTSLSRTYPPNLTMHTRSFSQPTAAVPHPLASPPVTSTPLAGASPRQPTLLASVLDAHEEEDHAVVDGIESEADEPTPFSHEPPPQPAEGAPSAPEAQSQSETEPTNAEKEPTPHVEAPPVVVPAIEEPAPIEPPKAPEQPALAHPTPSPSNLSATKPAGSLAERLARISRGSSPRPISPDPGPSAATSSAAPNKQASLPPPPSTSDSKNAVSSNAAELAATIQAVDKLLKQYTTVTSLSDLQGLEAFLKQQQTSASGASSASETLTRQLQTEKQKASQLEAELAQAKAATSKAEAKAKDEEEKKAKSITLLKAVRQKLIKAEKDKEEAEILRDASRASEEQAGADLKATRQRFEGEVLALRTAQEQQLVKLKASYEREANSIRASYEREAAARKGQFDVELLNLRNAHARELTSRDSRISVLEASLRDTRNEKDTLFRDLQSRQAEVEAATGEQARLQAAYEEMQYELREARDRTSALQDEVQSFKKARLDQTRDEGHTRRLLGEMEAAQAAKSGQYEDRIRALEKERSEVEERMAQKLQERLREVDKLRRELERRDAENSEETHRREERQMRIDRAEALNRTLQDKVHTLETLMDEVRADLTHAKEDLATANELLADQTRRSEELEARNEELQTKEAQLRQSNRTLREELRKVQSGVLLSEKSRNPGVGYFSNLNTSSQALSEARSPLVSPPATANGEPATPGGQSTSSNKEEEALNFEYIRNVILQFLEHKEMRPHLVSVLAVILQFTPAETRRLTAKASA